MLFQNFLFVCSLIFFEIIYAQVQKLDMSRFLVSDRLFSIIFCVSFALNLAVLLIIYYMDTRNIGIIAYAAGISLNLLVILANKGQMPVDMKIYIKNIDPYGYKDLSLYSRKHTEMSKNTRFNFLGDCLVAGYGGQGIYSIGDYIIHIGLVIWCYTAILNLIYRSVYFFFH